MVAEARTAVDVEAAVRQWARDEGFTAFFGVSNSGTFPQVVIQRIDGPDDDCRIQFDVWAADRSAGGSKAQAATAAAALATALTGLSSYVHAGVRLHGADWLSSQWLPDPQSDRSRYIVEAIFTAYAA